MSREEEESNGGCGVWMESETYWRLRAIEKSMKLENSSVSCMVETTLISHDGSTSMRWSTNLQNEYRKSTAETWTPQLSSDSTCNSKDSTMDGKQSMVVSAVNHELPSTITHQPSKHSINTPKQQKGAMNLRRASAPQPIKSAKARTPLYQTYSENEGPIAEDHRR